MITINDKKLRFRSSEIIISLLIASAVLSTGLIGSAQAATCPGYGSSNCHVTNEFGGGAQYKGMKGTWTVKNPSGVGGAVVHTSWMVNQATTDFYELGWRKYIAPGENVKYYWAKRIGGVFYGPFTIADASPGTVNTYQIDDINQDRKWTMTISGFSAITDTVTVSWSAGTPKAGGESTNDQNSMPKNDFNNFKYWGGSPEQWRAWTWPVSYIVEDSYWLSYCSYDRWTIGKTGSDPAGCP